MVHGHQGGSAGTEEDGRVRPLLIFTEKSDGYFHIWKYKTGINFSVR